MAEMMFTESSLIPASNILIVRDFGVIIPITENVDNMWTGNTNIQNSAIWL